MALFNALFGRNRAPAATAEPAPSNTDPLQLQQWIAAWLAAKLKVDPAQVDPHVIFTDFGLDSLTAVSLSGALEQRLGRHISPSIAWEYPSVAELAAYLATGGSGSEAEDDFETAPASVTA